MDTYNFTRMARFRFCLSIVLLNAWTAVAIATEPPKTKDPEAVYVAVERARLFAGPSTDFYPTGGVVRGAALEVYHRTSNGWLGIRPPQGSFSWVPASQAYLLPGGRVIEITDANAVSWIGTELGSAKQYRWQVQLNVGEQLGVLGEATVKNGSDEREALWYKVAPPAGEFRWIEEAAVSKTPPATAFVQAEDSQVATNTASGDGEDATASGSEVIAASSEAKVKASGKPSTQAAVKTASAEIATEQVAAPKSARGPRPAQAASNRNQPQQRKPGSEWDGWYAFEMGEQGVKTPFLDKLSGRDRGPTAPSQKGPSSKHDPLIQDPFSLTMTGKPTEKPDPEKVVETARKQREWRDPRALRESRLAGRLPSAPSSSLESFVDRFERATESASGVLLAGDARTTSPTDAEDRGARTAGYDAAVEAEPTGMTSGSSANVNWYGLSETKPSGATGPQAMLGSQSNPALGRSGPNVVTSTADVAELQVALNNTVASSNGPWHLAPIAEHARYLIEHGPTAIDRGQARLLLERIEAFQNVSVRSQQLTGAQSAGQPPFQLTTTFAPQPPVQTASYSSSAMATDSGATTTLPASGSSYDATGWLVPVHAAGQDQPTHALTNDTGDIVAYVSPIAGLNLDRYRNQAVGITGLRGYMPQLQAAHIQAQRVSRIR